MQLRIDNAPYGVEVRTPLLYGRVPGQPVWQGGLWLDLLLPVPAPLEPAPAVVYLHHGGWRQGDRSYGGYPWNGPILAAHGFVVASVSYRFTSVAPFPAQLHDVKAAVRWLRANADHYGIDHDRIGALGDSAGGHLAALLGTTGDRPDLEGDCGSPGRSSRVQAVVARCAPYDFRTFSPRDPGISAVLDALFGGSASERAALRELASPRAHVTPESAPFLIIHGTLDETVPVEQARAMAGTLRDGGVPVTLHELEGVFHNLRPETDVPWGTEPWTELAALSLACFRSMAGQAAS
ncbi:alpha/beta hydrolase fold domain-containing protein [Microlunatus sp. GCM10028923]|uniref:alpha/beta hydrolase fold domain-containing protein n=1 Tax=Microlunatus sp. GCM10028923 TaxID=3273400 RepID=UPI0036238EA4